MAAPQVSRMDLQVYGMTTQICRMTIKMRMTEKGAWPILFSQPQIPKHQQLFHYILLFTGINYDFKPYDAPWQKDMTERYAITDAGKKSAVIFRWFVFGHEHSCSIAYTCSKQVLPFSEKSYYQTNRTEHNTCSKTKFLHNFLKTRYFSQYS